MTGHALSCATSPVTHQHMCAFDASPAWAIDNGTGLAVLNRLYWPREANLARQICGYVLDHLMQRAVEQDVRLAFYPGMACPATGRL